MANLVPKISVDEIENKPERDVARMLVDQLPSQVTIFHSYPWLRPDRHDRTGDAGSLRHGVVLTVGGDGDRGVGHAPGSGSHRRFDVCVLGHPCRCARVTRLVLRSGGAGCDVHTDQAEGEGQG